MKFNRLMLTALLMFLPLVGMGQIFAPEGVNMPGTWDSFSNPPSNEALRSSVFDDGRIQLITNGTRRYQTIFSVDATGADVTGGTFSWLFTSGPESNRFQNKWAGVTPVTVNTVQNYTRNAGADNSITLTNGKFYTVNFRDNGYNNTDAIFMETSAMPVTISSVTNNAASTVRAGDDVTVTVTISAEPASDENFYLIYTITGSADRKVAALSFTGTTATHVFSGVEANKTYSYYVMSSSLESAAIIDDQSAEFYDMRSIRVNNNAGTNYSFSVELALPGKPVISAPATSATGVLLNATLDWDDAANSSSYEVQVSTDSGFTSPTTVTPSTSQYAFKTELNFGTTYHVRVRGKNSGDETGDWSDTVSFTTLNLTRTYAGNMLSGFGGVIGTGSIQIGDNGTDIQVRIVKGEGNFNDAFVMYIANGSTGRNVIDAEVNDQQDNLRRAISSAGDNASVLRFPGGFQATHALAVNLTFGGLWSIPATGSIGNDGLTFVSAVNRTLQANTDATVSLSFSKANLGLGAEDAISFAFVTTYLNAGNGFLSNESVNIGFGTSNPGAGNVTFGSALKYPSGEVYAMYTLSGGQGWRFLGNPIANATYGQLLNGLHTQGYTGSGFPDVGAANSNVRVLSGSSYVSISNASDVPAAGTGFAVGVYRDDTPGTEGSFPKFVTLQGAARTGDVSPSLPASADQYALLGNPFLGTLNFEATTRTGLNDVIYVYDYESAGKGDPDVDNTVGEATVGVFRAWNGSAGSLGSYRIAPFQGFLVSTNAEGATLTMSTSNLVGGNPVFRGKEAGGAMALGAGQASVSATSALTASLEISGNGLRSSAWLHFAEEASAGLDSRDAFKLYPFSSQYALLQTYTSDGVGLDINHLPVPGATTVIALDLETTVSGTYTLRAGNWQLPDDWSVVLRDTWNGAEYRLDADAEVTLAIEAVRAKVRGGSEDGGLPGVMQVSAEGAPRFALVVTPGAVTSVETGGVDVPRQVELYGNYPNPFNPVTQIQFALPVEMPVRLEVFDMLGRRVAVLHDGLLRAGTHTMAFQAGNLGSGVYVYRLEAGGSVITRKMTLMK
jgi:hypothetical protein